MANGLLGNMMNPEMMGLLGASAGLLQAGGPSRMPVNLGQGISQGLMGGMQGYQQAQQGAMQAQIQQAQLDEMKRKAAEGRPGFTLKPGEVRYDHTGKQVATLGDAVDSQPVTPVTIIGPDGKPQIINARNGKVIGSPVTEKPSSPFYSPVSTPQGLMSFDARTGKLAPLQVGGNNVMRATDDPTHQGSVAAARAGGKERGESQATSQIDLPRVIDNANNAMGLIDQMVGAEGPQGRGKPHPGFSSAVGLRVPGMTLVPGTEAANFQAMLDQVKGGAFLEAFNSLKGGGQITEVEGKKATDAITRMSNAQSEREFIRAAREYQDIIRKGVDRAKVKAGQQPERRSETRNSSQRVVVDF